MEIFINLILVSIGGLLLYFGGEGLVRGASSLAFRYKVSPMVVGLTVVAFGTSAPELVVCTLAALQGSWGISIGNVIGSNIANIGLILGSVGLLGAVAIERSTIRVEMPFVLIISIALWLLCLGGVIERTDGIFLLLLFGAFLIYCVKTSHRVSEEPSLDDALLAALRTDIIYIAIGLTALIGGSELFVSGAAGVARVFGVSEYFIGLSMVAMGTSLPELVASIIACSRGRADLAVGNVVGSNIFNILLVQGTVATIMPLQVDEAAIIFDLPIMVGFALVLLLLALIFQRLGRIGGGFFVCSYLGYIAYIAVR